jgi:hypothetical protein
VSLAQHRLARASADGRRYATRALPNPCRAGTAGCPFTDIGGCPTVLRRRPSSNEVIQFVRQSAGNPAGLVVEVNVAPCIARSGDAVQLSARYEQDLGPLAQIANRLGVLVAGRAPLPSSIQIDNTLAGFEE